MRTDVSPIRTYWAFVRVGAFERIGQLHTCAQLTPSSQPKHEHKSCPLRIEDADQFDVEIPRFHRHPRHSRQGEVVKEHRGDYAASLWTGAVYSHYEYHVEAEQGDAEVDQNAASPLAKTPGGNRR